MPANSAVPWRIYLLIDPTTRRKNHPLGQVFYVGIRDDLPEPVDLREVTEPQSLPEVEGPARERLERLNEQGVRVVVEVIPEQDWQNSASGLTRAVGSLCATLHPAPLNVRAASVRWPASLAQTIERASTVALPEEGAIIRRHQGEVPVATLPLLDQDNLFKDHVEVVEGRTSPSAISNRLRRDGPMPLLLVAEGRRGRGVLPSDFVLGAWMVDAIERLNESQHTWRVVRAKSTDVEGALRRRYVHCLVNSSGGMTLRKA